MSAIKVECYAGYRGEQRPVRFFLQGRALEVRDIEDQWYGPSARYFRVYASDGDRYVLNYDEEEDSWNLTAYRKTV